MNDPKRGRGQGHVTYFWSNGTDTHVPQNVLLVDNNIIHKTSLILYDNQNKPLYNIMESFPWKHQPASVRVQFMFTEVDSCNTGHAEKLTSDGHSSTAGHRTIQWSHTVHWNLTHWHCKFNRVKTYRPLVCMRVQVVLFVIFILKILHKIVNSIRNTWLQTRTDRCTEIDNISVGLVGQQRDKIARHNAEYVIYPIIQLIDSLKVAIYLSISKVYICFSKVYICYKFKKNFSLYVKNLHMF